MTVATAEFDKVGYGPAILPEVPCQHSCRDGKDAVDNDGEGEKPGTLQHRAPTSRQQYGAAMKNTP